MNILLLTHSYPDEGIKWRGSFIREQAKALSQENDVTVVYFKVDYSRLKPFSKYSSVKKEDGRLTEYYLTTYKSLPVINQLKYLFDTWRFIRREILKYKRIDLINSHLSYPAGFLGTVIQKMTGIPNILTEHTFIRKYFRSFIHRRCVIYALRKCSSIIAVSTSLKQDIGLFTRTRVTVIPNVVDSDKFSPVVSKVKNSGANLGILGSYNTDVKGLDILLEAVALIKACNITLHVGGTGILIDSYRKQADDLGILNKCIFYGEIAPEELNNFYGRLDFFVLPSRRETFGVVLVEAMSCGLPVISTRCGGPEDIVTSETGVLADKENPADLARAICYVMENPGSFNREEISKVAGKKYGPQNFVKSFSGLCKELAGTGRR